MTDYNAIYPKTLEQLIEAIEAAPTGEVRLSGALMTELAQRVITLERQIATLR